MEKKLKKRPLDIKIDDIKVLIAADKSRTPELKKLAESSWRWNGGFVYVTFKRPSYKQVADSAQLPTKYPLSSPKVIQLVQAMGDQNYSIKELTELCGYADPKHFREGYIKPALAENTIELLYADQPNHPKQKYRLTEASKEWKSNNQQLS